MVPPRDRGHLHEGVVLLEIDVAVRLAEGRLGLEQRPSPVKPGEEKEIKKPAAAPVAAAAPKAAASKPAEKKPMVDLKVSPAPNGSLDHTWVIRSVLRVQPPGYLHGGWWRGSRIQAEDPVHLF